jgi:hypothetical protein
VTAIFEPELSKMGRGGVTPKKNSKIRRESAGLPLRPFEQSRSVLLGQQGSVGRSAKTNQPKGDSINIELFDDISTYTFFVDSVALAAMSGLPNRKALITPWLVDTLLQQCRDGERMDLDTGLPVLRDASVGWIWKDTRQFKTKN